MVDSHYLGYELSWEDSVLDVVDNFIHRVFQRTVTLHRLVQQTNLRRVVMPRIFFFQKVKNLGKINYHSK